MSESNTTGNMRVCLRCGAQITAFAPGGVCPSCLVTSVIDSTDEGETETEVSATLPGAPEIADFRLTELLGEGGFGQVFAAEQLRPIQREVAVKVLKPGAGGEHSLARFESEAQALALMDHPGIAHVFDAGESEDGRPFIIMERIDGAPILEFCKERGLDLDERLALFQQICAAVGHAHRRGIIHRDIKPSNILIGVEGGVPEPKVIDFGIAKGTDSLLTERTLLTQQNQMLGTPAYMSPEQAEGRGAIDVRSDIYSLGVLLYELVTGTPPFREEEFRTLAYDEVLSKIRTESPPRPTTRARETRDLVVGKLSSDLDWIVMRAIEKDPARRYETADALGRDVLAFLSGEAIEARPPSAAYRLRNFVRRNRGAVAASTAILLALVAGTIVSFVMFLRAEDNAVLAKQSAAEAEQSEARNRQQFSLAEFAKAKELVASRPGVAVAHLTRAVRIDPGNHAAATRLLNLLASEDWPTKSFPPIDHGQIARTVAFSPDGTRLLVAGDARTFDVHDAASGKLLKSIPIKARCLNIEQTADGRFAAVETSENLVLFDMVKMETVRWMRSTRGFPTGCSFSANGRWLAAGFHGGAVRVWEVAKGKLVSKMQLEIHRPFVRFAPTDDRLAISDKDSGVRLVTPSPDSDSDLDSLEPVSAEILGMCFTPDGRRLVLRCGDSTVRTFDFQSGREIAVMPHLGALVETFEINADGSLVLTGDDAGKARVFDLETGRLLGEPVSHAGRYVRASFSPDGRWVASSSALATELNIPVKVWDARSGAPICAPFLHPRGVLQLAWSPDGRRIAVASRSRMVAVWGIRQSSMHPTTMRHPDAVWRAGFDEGGERLYTLMPDGRASAWDATTGKALSDKPQTFGEVAVAAHRCGGHTLRHGQSHRRTRLLPHNKFQRPEDLVAPDFREGGVRAFAASADGEKLATGCADRKVRVWSLRDGRLLDTFGDFDAPLSVVAFDQEGRIVAGGDLAGCVEIHRLGQSVALFSGQMHSRRVDCLSFSADSDVLASGGNDKRARILHLKTRVLGEPLEHEGAISQLAFSPDCGLLATSGIDNTARVWTVATGELLGVPLRHLDVASNHGLYLMWRSADHLVTTASHDNTARVWDVHSGRQLVPSMSQLSGAISAALSPDRRALLFGGDIGAHARVWDLGTGIPLTKLLQGDERVICTAFSPRGDRLVTGTLGGTTYVYPMPPRDIELPDEFLQYAESLGGFRFNPGGLLETSPPIDRSALPEFGNPWLRWLTTSAEGRLTNNVRW